jgi:hypothetical protein
MFLAMILTRPLKSRSEGKNPSPPSKNLKEAIMEKGCPDANPEPCVGEGVLPEAEFFLTMVKTNDAKGHAVYCPSDTYQQNTVII